MPACLPAGSLHACLPARMHARWWRDTQWMCALHPRGVSVSARCTPFPLHCILLFAFKAAMYNDFQLRCPTTSATQHDSTHKGTPARSRACTAPRPAHSTACRRSTRPPVEPAPPPAHCRQVQLRHVLLAWPHTAPLRAIPAPHSYPPTRTHTKHRTTITHTMMLSLYLCA